MSRIIDIDTTLDASGGANYAVSQTSPVNTDSAALHIEIGGATTAADIHVEARLASDLGWVDWIVPETGVANGYADISGLDIGDLTNIRVRIVNQDGTNTADVRAVVETGGR